MTEINYRLKYENIPKKRYKLIKENNKMSKDKQVKEYKKTRGEHIKDVVIAILVTGIVMFIAGVAFQSRQQEIVQSAVKAVTPVVESAPLK